jgi:hypothetical protein
MLDRRLVVSCALALTGSMACAGGARNPFDESIASASVGHAPSTEGTGSEGSDTDGAGSQGSDPSDGGTSTEGETTEPGGEDGSPCEVAEDCGAADACTEIACDPVTGCVITPVVCNDGDACTDDSCDPQLGCVHDPIVCDDGDACTVDDCDPGQGCVHEPVDCDDGITCTQDSCDALSGQCVHEPNHALCDDGDACTGMATCDTTMGCLMGTPVVCNDGNACTENVCNPQNGQCSHPAIQACIHNDGCCPVGCSAANDNDCTCTNLAGPATPTNSGGGSNDTGYGPSNLNDGVTKAQCAASACNQCFAWMQNSTSSAGWFQLEWNASVTIGSMFVEGEHATNPSCGSSGRNLAAGDVQWWNGNAWITATSWAGNNENLFFEFNPPLQTTRIRLANVFSGPGNGNSMAFEWFVYQPLGCTP